MTEPWFSQETARWFTALSLLSMFAVLETFAQRGRYRMAVYAVGLAGCALGVALLIAALTAWAAGQPFFVRMPLLVGGIVTAPCSAAV
jgi:uncharacterized membrane protein YkvI